MAKRNALFNQAEQSERFKKSAQELIDAGELDPTEAECALDAIVRRAKTARPINEDEPRRR